MSNLNLLSRSNISVFKQTVYKEKNNHKNINVYFNYLKVNFLGNLLFSL